MKNLILEKPRFILCILGIFSFFFTESSHAQLAVKSTISSANGAEISVFDPGTNRVFTVAGNAIEYYTLNSAGVLSSPTAIPYGFTPAAGTTALPNSVAVNNGVLVFSFAIVNSTTNAQELGKVAFYNPATATYISDVTVGYLPDMVAFSPNGTKILTANEGEPNSYGVVGTSFDPEGSVSIIDISNGIASATVTEASFTSFNSQMASLKAAGVRIYGPGSTVAQDLEPEYIAFMNNQFATVTLQENNAVAIVDISTGTVTNIYPLGLKDHSIAGNGFDASDRDLTSSTGKINIQNWPVKGMYMPDAIASFTSGDVTYFITANEGDSRAYTGYSEEIRVGVGGYVLDPTIFPNATTLKTNANLGRLQLTNASGDTDGDGDFDEIHALGARSFTIWNTNFTPVFDSGDQLEQITASQSAASFNSDGLAATFDTRSDNKGPEPEAVTTGTVNGVLYAFVGSERTGDIFMYDITNPAAPVFKQYINTTADMGVEGIIFVPASQSPTGNALVITSAEVSKTVSVYEFTPPSVNLAVSTNTASETAGTVVTVIATASEPVFGDKTVAVSVSGTNITAADYNLSNATITIPSGSTTGSVTFTIVSDNTVESLETAELTISNPSSGIALGTTTSQTIAISDFVFTLQVLHASDFEGAVEAVQDAPRFAAIVDQLEESYVNTIKLSSGDNYIPGPFLSSGEDASLAPALKTAYESYYNTTFSSSSVNLLPSIGRPDISILNFIGIEASALGNHEFDLGTTEVRNIIRGANSSSTVRSWFGAQFPYVSSNLNFSGDSNLSAIATTDRLRLNTSFMSNPSETVAANTAKTKLAPSTIIMKGGQKIGIVGCTTQILASISSPGATTVVGGGANDMNILAGIVQPVVDALIADGCNKIILLSHLQQIAFEKELAGKLTGVDIIMAGGSNTLMADANDRLRAGDIAAESYPYLTTGMDGKALALINTDGNYKYVGRLVVDFDADGMLIPSSIDPVISGVYAADAQGLNDVWGANVANAYAVGTRGYQVQLLCNAIENVINSKDGNLFGKTAVFLEGRRNIVRTEETNLGNITAEANLWMAKFYDPTTVISIKNAGGIRSAIGNVIAVGDDLTLSPPIANVGAGKQAGDISQLDIENSLRFNNQLSLVTLTATGLRAVLEHAVNGTTATATPGQFAQVAGVRYSYNFSNAVGSKILNAVVTDASGNIIDTLVLNGVTQGDLTRTFRVVTLSFLAGGGDSYPFVALSSNRLDLNSVPEQGPAMASFATAGSEQDVFAEYMKSQYSSTPYGIAETALVNDCRVQRVPARADNVLPPSAGTIGTLVICESATVTENQLFAALGGTPQTGGTWSPALAGAGVYSYTINSLCAGSASATVTVSTAPNVTYYADADGDGYGNAAVSVIDCVQPLSYVTNSTDCNDSVAAVNPGQTEILYNGVDDNCDGQLDEGFQLITTLQSVSCGVTVPSMGSLIYANINFSASGYRFKVVNNATGAIQIINRSQHWFALNMLANYEYATTYTISVELQKAGIWLGYYGSTCEVSTPAVLSPTGALQVNPSQCGITLASIGSVIATTPLGGATGYRFRVTDVTPGATGANLIQVRDRSYHWFTLPMLSRFNYGSTYLVEVAVKTTAGYSAYGSACTIYSPALPGLASCSSIIPTAGSLVYTTALTSATQYRFQVTNSVDQTTVTFDTNKYWFSFRVNVPGYTPETAYSVRVAVMTSGTWSPFGDACEIVSPTAAARSEEVSAFDMQVLAYPNPFTSEFKLNVTTFTEGAVELKVYDMLGKLIETRSINTIDYISEDLGSSYPAGVYNVIVTQGENAKTLRMIKR